MNFIAVRRAPVTLFNYLVNILLFIAGTVLALMMFLTAADVICRYLLNIPIAGAFETVEFLMAIFISFSVVYCEKRKMHISVDIITDRLPAIVRKVLAVPVAALTLVFFALVSWQCILYVGEEFESKMTSPVLLISIYPFIIPVALAFVILTFLLLFNLLETISSFTRN